MAYAQAMARAYAWPIDFTGNAMKGFVYVAPKGFESEEELM